MAIGLSGSKGGIGRYLILANKKYVELFRKLVENGKRNYKQLA